MARWWSVLIVGAMACGASSAELHTAKTAIYNGDPRKIMEIALEVTRETYKVGEIDAATMSFITEPKFYSREGDLESPGVGDFVHLRAGSVQVQFVVEVTTTADQQSVVSVTPRTFQVIGGSPKPRELRPDDPYLPTFVTGRADSLALAIYDRAKPFVAAPPGTH